MSERVETRPGKVSFVETPKVDVADAEGAGDSFTGAFCVPIQKGKDIPTCGLVLITNVNISDKGRFRLGVWGGTNTQGTYKEFNHHAIYAYEGFSLAFWDTYNFSPQLTIIKSFSTIRHTKRVVF